MENWQKDSVVNYGMFFPRIKSGPNSMTNNYSFVKILSSNGDVFEDVCLLGCSRVDSDQRSRWAYSLCN
jgi:hypothetical protein